MYNLFLSHGENAKFAQFFESKIPQIVDGAFSASTAEVTKIMAAEPRRISEIQVIFNMNLEADEKAIQYVASENEWTQEFLKTLMI